MYNDNNLDKFTFSIKYPLLDDVGNHLLWGLGYQTPGTPIRSKEKWTIADLSQAVIDANSSLKALVKEQRLDGSLHPSYYKKTQGCLRCGLTGFERDYKVKIPTKQINKVIFYSTLRVNQTQELIINP